MWRAAVRPCTLLVFMFSAAYSDRVPLRLYSIRDARRGLETAAARDRHWSCRKLASELGISKDLMHRVWREAGLKPHRLERYMASDDPDFESKAGEIIGLYLNPPQHAAAFCVDEKTTIQALYRRVAWPGGLQVRSDAIAYPSPDSYRLVRTATQSISMSNGPGHTGTHVNIRAGGSFGKKRIYTAFTVSNLSAEVQ